MPLPPVRKHKKRTTECQWRLCFLTRGIVGLAEELSPYLWTDTLRGPLVALWRLRSVPPYNGVSDSTSKVARLSSGLVDCTSDTSARIRGACSLDWLPA